ncbi:threonine--tRNA ligase [Candidatus Peregrinibacteria bacterium CG_4_9_14_0_2_um_filter_53_11]|nr:MAG: threonine--tRNA ligase [Candidatus Peregrinibacteria bacterium CG_4_9_14_0_2_um_filter_53_11]
MSKLDKSSHLYQLRHSCSHALAQAVLQMFPEAKLAIGPPIEKGFYYDFDLPRPLIPEDLAILEKKMKEIIHEKQTFVRREESIGKALEVLKKANQPYKVDLVEGWKKDGSTSVSFYENVDRHGTVKFVDLCEGNHVENMGEIKAVKLLHTAGAYWRGDEKNPMLQRIYGTCFETKEELNTYLQQLEEAKKRDHKILGKQLELFAHSALVGGGLPLFLPKGTQLRENLMNFITKEKKARGYKFVTIPHIAKDELYMRSGHLGKYDAMMPIMETEDGDRLVMKAMNCPHHFELYKAQAHSYRSLPLRYAENTVVYRNEKSGEINGLLRVRALTQDDTHHFVRYNQIASEIDMILGLMQKVYARFGFTKYRARVSTRDLNNPDKYFGTDEVWNMAEKNLIEGVQRWGAEYFIGEGEAAFYGPKIDIMVEDALGREWQLTTVQMDFIQPKNFELTYTNEEGKDEYVAVLHVAIYGSFERFMAIIIEQFGGAFPSWLAPVQAKLLPVSDAFLEYAHTIREILENNDIRIEVDDANDTLGKKIRNAELQKVPYMLVIGQKEMDEQKIAVRDYATKKQEVMSVMEFVEKIKAEAEA